MSSKKITSAVSKYGERKYKYSARDTERRIHERKFLDDLRKLIYPGLEIPTYRNIVFSNSEVFDLVARAGLRHSFIEDTSNSINRKAGRKVVPDADTVYYRLKKLGLEEWKSRWSAANGKMMKLARKRGMIPVLPSFSVDVHPVMFYGDKDAYGVMGTRPMKGSHRAFKYLTGCFSDCNSHLSPAALPLIKGLELWDALEVLLLEALRYVNHRFLVYMDREFYSTPVIRLLEEYGQKYLMPAKKTRPIKQLMKENPSPCVLRYSIKGKYGTVDTTIVLVDDDEGKTRAFATNLNIDASQAKTLFDLYENRWTVDTSYRMVGQVRMNSKTVDYGVRWFLFFFSLLMMNGYWLFNDFIREDGDHVTLITFAEMFIEVSMELFEFPEVKMGNGWQS